MTTEDAAELRSEDVAKFLAVFRYAEGCPPQRRRSYRELMEEQFKPLNTTLGQLARVAEFFFGSAGRGSGVDRLFRVSDEDGGVVATDEARVLVRILRVYRSFASRLREQFREQLQPAAAAPVVVRLGCPETIGFRLLASVLSDWQAALPGVDLHLTIDNSRLLIPRLHAGMLDLIAAYGPEDDQVPDATYDVTFASLGYPSRMCLLCHPAVPLWAKSGKNLNAGYWARSYADDNQAGRRANRTSLGFSKLRAVRLDELDFQKCTLVTVPSWRQPRAVEECATQLRNAGIPARLTDSYDEALALVRMRLGVAVVPEVFSRRDHVTAFRLLPESAFRRWIGLYYNSRIGLHPAACRVAELLRDYCREFEASMRAGETPSFGDTRFSNWWSSLTANAQWASRDWLQFSRERYPTALTTYSGSSETR